MLDRKIIEELQSYCDRLNKYLPCKTQEDVDSLSEILNELFENVKGSRLYWSREIYIDSGFDLEKCMLILIYRNCRFIPVDDIEEHLGIKVIYNYESMGDTE